MTYKPEAGAEEGEKACAPCVPPYLWRPADSALAVADGWDLFEADGKMEIQKDDCVDTFESDEAALAYVVERALIGSKLAAKALLLDGRSCDDPVHLPPSLR